MDSLTAPSDSQQYQRRAFIRNRNTNSNNNSNTNQQQKRRKGFFRVGGNKVSSQLEQNTNVNGDDAVLGSRTWDYSWTGDTTISTAPGAKDKKSSTPKRNTKIVLIPANNKQNHGAVRKNYSSGKPFEPDWDGITMETRDTLSARDWYDTNPSILKSATSYDTNQASMRSQRPTLMLSPSMPTSSSSQREPPSPPASPIPLRERSRSVPKSRSRSPKRRSPSPKSRSRSPAKSRLSAPYPSTTSPTENNVTTAKTKIVPATRSRSSSPSRPVQYFKASVEKNTPTSRTPSPSRPMIKPSPSSSTQQMIFSLMTNSLLDDSSQLTRQMSSATQQAAAVCTQTADQAATALFSLLAKSDDSTKGATTSDQKNGLESDATTSSSTATATSEVPSEAASDEAVHPAPPSTLDLLVTQALSSTADWSASVMEPLLLSSKPKPKPIKTTTVTSNTNMDIKHKTHHEGNQKNHHSPSTKLLANPSGNNTKNDVPNNNSLAEGKPAASANKPESDSTKTHNTPSRKVASLSKNNGRSNKPWWNNIMRQGQASSKQPLPTVIEDAASDDAMDQTPPPTLSSPSPTKSKKVTPATMPDTKQDNLITKDVPNLKKSKKHAPIPLTTSTRKGSTITAVTADTSKKSLAEPVVTKKESATTTELSRVPISAKVTNDQETTKEAMEATSSPPSKTEVSSESANEKTDSTTTAPTTSDSPTSWSFFTLFTKNEEGKKDTKKTEKAEVIKTEETHSTPVEKTAAKEDTKPLSPTVGPLRGSVKGVASADCDMPTPAFEVTSREYHEQQQRESQKPSTESFINQDDAQSKKTNKTAQTKKSERTAKTAETEVSKLTVETVGTSASTVDERSSQKAEDIQDEDYEADEAADDVPNLLSLGTVSREWSLWKDFKRRRPAKPDHKYKSLQSLIQNDDTGADAASTNKNPIDSKESEALSGLDSKDGEDPSAISNGEHSSVKKSFSGLEPDWPSTSFDFSRFGSASTSYSTASGHSPPSVYSQDSTTSSKNKSVGTNKNFQRQFSKQRSQATPVRSNTARKGDDQSVASSVGSRNIAYLQNTKPEDLTKEQREVLEAIQILSQHPKLATRLIQARHKEMDDPDLAKKLADALSRTRSHLSQITGMSSHAQSVGNVSAASGLQQSPSSAHSTATGRKSTSSRISRNSRVSWANQSKEASSANRSTDESVATWASRSTKTSRSTRASRSDGSSTMEEGTIDTLESDESAFQSDPTNMITVDDFVTNEFVLTVLDSLAGDSSTVNSENEVPKTFKVPKIKTGRSWL